MHHPFTSTHPEDVELLNTDPGAARANAYDMVINGVEVGGGSIRIFDRDIQVTRAAAVHAPEGGASSVCPDVDK